MNAKHTPGPWKIAGQYAGTKVYRICSGPYTIANVEHPGHGHKDTPLNEKECAANANLIAAAPDLLAALEDCVKRYGTGYNDMDIEIRNARAAIAKAKRE